MASKKKKKKKKKKKTVLAWGGFTDGELHACRDSLSLGCPLMFSVFKNRSRAKEQYDDVRRVRIVPVTKKKRTKR